MITYALKRRLLVVTVLLLWLWLPIHFVLINRLDISSWRLNGLAMYCAPPPQYERSIYLQGPNEAPSRVLTNEQFFGSEQPKRSMHNWVLGRAVQWRAEARRMLSSEPSGTSLVVNEKRAIYSGRRHRYVDRNCSTTYRVDQGVLRTDRFCRSLDDRAWPLP